MLRALFPAFLSLCLLLLTLGNLSRASFCSYPDPQKIIHDPWSPPDPTPPLVIPDTAFAQTLSCDDGWIVTSDPLRTVTSNNVDFQNSGIVYLYSRSGGFSAPYDVNTGILIENPWPQNTTHFGISLVLRRSYLFVVSLSSTLISSASNNYRLYAFVYHDPSLNGSWSLHSVLNNNAQSPKPISTAVFSYDSLVDIHDTLDIAVVASPFNRRLYVYRLQGDSWALYQNIDASVGPNNSPSDFAYSCTTGPTFTSVSIDNNLILYGIPNARTTSVSQGCFGVVVPFYHNQTSYHRLPIVVPPQGVLSSGCLYGASVAFNDAYLVVSATNQATTSSDPHRITKGVLFAFDVFQTASSVSFSYVGPLEGPASAIPSPTPFNCIAYGTSLSLVENADDLIVSGLYRGDPTTLGLPTSNPPLIQPVLRYRHNGTSWSSPSLLVDSRTPPYNDSLAMTTRRFGISSACCDGRTVIGSPSDRDENSTLTGLLFVACSSHSRCLLSSISDSVDALRAALDLSITDPGGYYGPCSLQPLRDHTSFSLALLSSPNPFTCSCCNAIDYFDDAYQRLSRYTSSCLGNETCLYLESDHLLIDLRATSRIEGDDSSCLGPVDPRGSQPNSLLRNTTLVSISQAISIADLLYTDGHVASLNLWKHPSFPMNTLRLYEAARLLCAAGAIYENLATYCKGPGFAEEFGMGRDSPTVVTVSGGSQRPGGTNYGADTVFMEDAADDGDGNDYVGWSRSACTGEFNVTTRRKKDLLCSTLLHTVARGGGFNASLALLLSGAPKNPYNEHTVPLADWNCHPHGSSSNRPSICDNEALPTPIASKNDSFFFPKGYEDPPVSPTQGIPIGTYTVRTGVLASPSTPCFYSINNTGAQFGCSRLHSSSFPFFPDYYHDPYDPCDSRRTDDFFPIMHSTYDSMPELPGNLYVNTQLGSPQADASLIVSFSIAFNLDRGRPRTRMDEERASLPRIYMINANCCTTIDFVESVPSFLSPSTSVPYAFRVPGPNAIAWSEEGIPLSRESPGQCVGGILAGNPCDPSVDPLPCPYGYCTWPELVCSTSSSNAGSPCVEPGGGPCPFGRKCYGGNGTYPNASRRFGCEEDSCYLLPSDPSSPCNPSCWDRSSLQWYYLPDPNTVRYYNISHLVPTL